MDGKERPRSTPEQAHAQMDHLIALGIVAQHDMAQRLGLNVTDLTCMGFILEAEGAQQPLTAGDLAQRANLTTGAITGVINRLERAGYARRRNDPNDRRRVHVIADPTAAERLFQAYGTNYRRIAELFADYTPQEIAVLNDCLTRATTILTTSLEETRTTGNN
ncbi:MarR family transcriptional regulator [Streptomyces sp. NPDC046324]|uniref:MarR family winged helix-turn-helix transcriptional regulator n=1 Tax=Streptomyces sp. NPDC046324 TaxID=3154915 RepID=UPI0033C676D5